MISKFNISVFRTTHHLYPRLKSIVCFAIEIFVLNYVEFLNGKMLKEIVLVTICTFSTEYCGNIFYEDLAG